MTPDQIRALKPGPELDRAVYEALFDEQTSLPGPRRLIAYPSYSTTWKGLGLVVEEMERRGYLIDIDAFLHRQQRFFGAYVWRIPPRPCGNVECIHGSCQPSRVADYESADRFEAACKAALLALAAERGQTP